MPRVRRRSSRARPTWPSRHGTRGAGRPEARDPGSGPERGTAGRAAGHRDRRWPLLSTIRIGYRGRGGAQRVSDPARRADSPDGPGARSRSSSSTASPAPAADGSPVAPWPAARPSAVSCRCCDSSVEKGKLKTSTSRAKPAATPTTVRRRRDSAERACTTPANLPPRWFAPAASRRRIEGTQRKYERACECDGTVGRVRVRRSGDEDTQSRRRDLAREAKDAVLRPADATLVTPDPTVDPRRDRRPDQKPNSSIDHCRRRRCRPRRLCTHRSLRLGRVEVTDRSGTILRQFTFRPATRKAPHRPGTQPTHPARTRSEAVGCTWPLDQIGPAPRP